MEKEKIIIREQAEIICAKSRQGSTKFIEINESLLNDELAQIRQRLSGCNQSTDTFVGKDL